MEEESLMTPLYSFDQDDQGCDGMDAVVLVMMVVIHKNSISFWLDIMPLLLMMLMTMMHHCQQKHFPGIGPLLPLMFFNSFQK